AAEVWRAERLLLGEHAPAARRQAVGRVAVLVVEEDDAGRHREGVGAVGPLLALLLEEVVAAARHHLELEAERRQRAEQRLLQREGQLAAAQVDAVDARRLGAARLDDRRVA